ncbi:MAG: energy transducer TonB, partial [Chromatiales bacterium]
AAPPASATVLISQSLAMASLNAELAQRLEARAKRPKRKFISATTTEYRYAAYMEAWRTKVERVGNLNYPEEARRNKLAGSLILDVALRADGSVFDIAVRRPSGFKLLDQAAIRIVNLAQPFAPFPDNISSEVDILHITRSWQFMHNHRLSSN